MQRIERFVPRMAVSMRFLGLVLTAAIKPPYSFWSPRRPTAGEDGRGTCPHPGGRGGRAFGASRLGVFAVLAGLVLAGLGFPAAAQQTIFGDLAPTGVFDNAQRQLGLRFQSDVAGQISAIRFYRVATNGCDTDAHMGYVYDLAGIVLASVAIPASDVTGWQEQELATPVSIDADTTYVVAVDELGCYGATVDSGLPLSNGQNLTGLVGVFSDSASAFPTTESGNNASFFRDIVFETTQTQTGACIAGGKFVSVDGLAGPYVRNSITVDNPDSTAANPKITFVPGTNDIPADSVDIPAAIIGGTPVLYQFEIVNCGDAVLHNVRVDDCIDVRSVGDDGFLIGGVGDAGENDCEQPRFIPVSRLVAEQLAPGQSVTVHSYDFPDDPISPDSTNFIDVCETYGGERVEGIVRNDVEYEAEADLNGDGTGETFVFFDELNLVQCLPPVEVASLGDRVWEDLNANGVQDCLDTNGDGIIGNPGDIGPECAATGIGGVTVELYGPDCNALITSETTDQDGFYAFLDLDASQQYCIRFDQTSAGMQLGCDADLGGLAASPQNATLNDALDSDANPTTGQTANISLTPGVFDRTWDAGFYCLSKLGDQVWNDLNRDGIQDDVPNTEPGIPGVPVALFKCDAAGKPPAVGMPPITNTVTDSAGIYGFAGLMPGIYYVSFTAPSGFVFSPQNVGADDTVDSDANNNGNTLVGGKCPIDLPPNTFDPTWDAGLNKPPTAELGDFVFEDRNADGIQDEGEPGIPGVPLNLFGPDCQGNAIASTTTDENGLYLFDNLTGGTYCIEFVKETVDCAFGAPSFSPANQGNDDAKDSDANPVTGQTGDILLPEGVSDRTWDAGVYCPAKLGDQVWDDLNQSGLQDNVPTTEPGVPGVTVNLLDCNGNPVTDLDGFSSRITNSLGIYTFPVKPGNYIVEFVAPVGKLFTTQNVGIDDTVDSDANPVSGRTTCISVPSNVYDHTWDAGLIPPPDCRLAIEKSCEVVAPPSAPFVCDDKIDAITMILDEAFGEVLSVTAYLGDTNDATLPDGNVTISGNEVTVTGYQTLGAPNDVVWVFTTTDGSGQSKFHLSCSDDEMDGETDDPTYPQDCGRPEGNGKDNSSGDNVWLLEGLVTDNAFVLDCTPPETTPMTDCEYEALFASCETLSSDPDTLTFQYTGGGCEATDNFQKPDDVSCTGSIDPTLPVTVVDADKETYTVELGGLFVVPRDGADKLTLTNSGGTEFLELHTSCSQPLQTGDVYGSLTLVALDGVGLGTDVLYSYLVANQGMDTISDISVVDDKLGEIDGSPIASLLSDKSTTLEASAFVLETTTNMVTATGTGAPGAACTATSESTVTVTPPAPCSVSVAFDKIEDDKIKYKLTNTGLPVARMETLVLIFDPGFVSIKEVKLDGTVYKLGDSSYPAIGPGDLIGETVPPANAVWTEDDSTKRQLDPGETRTLEIVFSKKQDKEDFTPDDFSGGVTFNDQECSVGF